jgi:ABC-2 type transport system permease protein
MFERIKQMIIKEFIQVFRDRRMIAIVFFTPVMQLLVFGYAVTTDVNNISTAIYDLDKSYESRELVRRLESSGYFNIRYFADSSDEMQELLDRGRITAAIQINRGFSSDLKNNRQTEVQILVDGTDSNTATVAMDYANRIIMKYAKDMGAQRVENPPNPPLLKGGEGGLDLCTRVWYNPDLRSRNYNVPGVIAIVIMLTCLLLTSMAVVREREIGTMEQLMVTPLKPIELMLGKTIPFAMISFFNMVIVTVVGIFWFNIPIKGSVYLLTGSTAIYLLSVLGIGLFISTISRTQQQAMMATFLFYIPGVLLSGFMFPIENMPEIIQYGTYLNPLRYFLVIIRGIFLKGNGIAILWPQMLSLFLLGIIVMTLSSLRFRKGIG